MLSHRSRGFTLLEVLIAIVVFSFGLLGLAGLMVMSVKTNHSAYQRTQATFLAQSMADRMRSNTMAVWSDDYNQSYPLSSSADPCALGTACTYTQIATHDNVAFDRMLSSLLPNATAVVECTPTAGITTPNLAADPPYNGLCSIQVKWAEAAVGKGDTAASTDEQTFAWVFQP